MRSPPCLLSLLFGASFLSAQSSSFQPSFQGTQFPTGCNSSDYAAQVIAGDFNGDHVTDLVMACGMVAAPKLYTQISVLLGKGDGTLQAPVVTSLVNTPVRNSDFGQIPIVAVDVNGDGKTDIVYSSLGSIIPIPGLGTVYSWTVTVLLSHGDGTFAPPNTVADKLTYSVWRAADLNGDGIDLVLSAIDGTGFAVMLGKGDGTFSTPTFFSAPNGGNAIPVAMADFNGDGKPDVITTNNGAPSIWLNKGDGSFGPPVIIASLTGQQTLMGDFNGDGKLDLGVNSTYFNVFLGNGDGTFQAPKPTLPMYIGELFGLDLNQDGRTDLAQENGAIGGIIFYLAQADGTFHTLSTLNLPAPALVADFNGDGKPDIAGVASSFDQVSIMINTTHIASTTGAANGASFVAGEPLTTGALASVFGTGFASLNVYASAIPLPTTLGNVSVTIGGFPAPLLFVSSKQINLQVPWEVAGTTADIVVTVNGTALTPFQAHIGPLSPGIFTTQSGVGQAIAINPDGSLAGPEGSIPATALHPAKVGEALVILATGLGPVTPKVADGENSSDALRNTVTKPKVTIGGESAEVLFSGLSPQFVGLNQINVTVPQVKAGVLPLQLSIGGITTPNQVTIAIQ